ncbi:hypothetical protein CSUB01_00468 [Colletotrichum sublineola]|uniref:Uncharacterized protein n=1 Tax=Colletotrichum sublineola TaxID=1173701 RepID=A0A066XFH5_COLSU|nr:hypothetical protein CSUB01_00468 [Colletotrichum sublineola]
MILTIHTSGVDQAATRMSPDNPSLHEDVVSKGVQVTAKSHPTWVQPISLGYQQARHWIDEQEGILGYAAHHQKRLKNLEQLCYMSLVSVPRDPDKPPQHPAIDIHARIAAVVASADDNVPIVLVESLSAHRHPVALIRARLVLALFQHTLGPDGDVREGRELPAALGLHDARRTKKLGDTHVVTPPDTRVLPTAHPSAITRPGPVLRPPLHLVQVLDALMRRRAVPRREEVAQRVDIIVVESVAVGVTPPDGRRGDLAEPRVGAEAWSHALHLLDDFLDCAAEVEHAAATVGGRHLPPRDEDAEAWDRGAGVQGVMAEGQGLDVVLDFGTLPRLSGKRGEKRTHRREQEGQWERST